ncbi:hypothetical protein DHW03_17790 [Pedobacter yonginense]|uniref:Uncharacterized protein n=1 Tax=Pedobacter yonginense TaxID=651869 RepID=A0A317EMW4_9SPHI|nr:hypothetical protein [Pedobacter yonginense]PWS26616.1 hypothetical protein DHW03_17790 [Pedobacter yonginense]
MTGKKKGLRIFNPSLTNSIINLQKNGYSYDFHKVDNDYLLCLQNNLRFSAKHLIIKAIELSKKSAKGLHTIETSTGERGLLLTEVDF